MMKQSRQHYSVVVQISGDYYLISGHTEEYPLDAESSHRGIGKLYLTCFTRDRQVRSLCRVQEVGDLAWREDRLAGKGSLSHIGI